MSTEETEELVERYIRFCDNPLRGRDAIKKEFVRLCNDEGVSHVGFHSSSTILIGTKPVYCLDEETDREYDLGEFIILITRRRQQFHWDIDYRFINTTIDPKGRKDDRKYIHPHIALEHDPNLQMENGRLCISKGSFLIKQSIRVGRIDIAAAKLIDILYTYHDNPFLQIEFWEQSGAIQ